MSEAKHTPGPWLVSGGTVYALHSDPKRNRFFAQVQRGRADDATHDELIANARLISAAPELLEALQNLLAVHEGEGGTKYPAGDIARAAIRKATGG